jgi:type IV pilus assembly protein PilB
MTDVDSIRWMASEHDLEFVDLDNYGVDPAAGEILPVELARRHHMVAIKRKFGTPVIATADPDDLYAQDSVRASIGRDFISVVASPDQIAAYIDRLFGPDPNVAVPAEPILDVRVDDAGATPRDDANVQFNGVVEDLIKEVEASRPDLNAEPPVDQSLNGDPVVTEAMSAGVAEVEQAETLSGEPEVPTPATTGKGRRGREGKRKKSTVDAVVEPPEPPVEPEATPEAPDAGLTADPAWSEVAAGGGYLETPVGPETALNDMFADSPVVDGAVHEATTEEAGSPEGTLVFESPADPFGPNGGLQFEDLEPATSLLPSFGSDGSGAEPPVDFPTPAPADPLMASVDQLAELAQSLQAEDQHVTGDDAVIAADLVDEAVAVYQEKFGEDQRSETDAVVAPNGVAMFPPLAKALVEGDRVPLETMESVLEEHYQTGQSIARILTAQKLVTEADLMWGMAQEMGLDFVDLDVVGIDLTEAGTIPEATARHHNVLVIANDNGTPVVAASNPTDVFAMDDLRTIMGRSFIVVVATRTQISHYIGQAFNSGGDAADMAMEASLGIEGNESGPVDDIQSITEEAPIVRYVNLLILQALNERASDIHIEPTAAELRIRYRIDGVLHDVSTAPRTIAPAVTTRLKVMADMNIAEHRVPQDGRISLNVGSKGIDLRMATLPTIYGEKIVMRVLDKSSVVLGFSDLGFDDDLLRTYEGLYTKPYGTILVTGPTGSGKSTTLYTTLTALNSPEKNIITVEDPVELPLKGVNQVQLNVKAGLNFAAALRAILRSDPDIVLVGEIRDKETAVISIEAALTGHMVLSTLHTNSAASTPMRLIEMGLEPFLVTSAVSGVLAQRLARRLCVHCKEAFEPTEADITSAGWKLEEVEAMGGMPKIYKAIGCSACSNTGYRGRKALAELLPMTEEIERVIIEGGSVEEIHRVGVAQGMSTLRQSGLRKAIEGETTLEEVLRVVA